MHKSWYLPLAILLSFFFSQNLHAQLQASNWYFGDNAGLNFDPITGAVTPLNNGALRTDEGCAAISDENGQLLFYTDGITVFDRTHNPMPNGVGLLGDPSSTQSGIIIPKPLSTTNYYIFTVDTSVGSDPDFGLHWYEVDMTLNSGLGDVITNISNPNNLLRDCSEKITAINKSGSDDILVTALASRNGSSSDYDTYYTYTVSPTGVDPTPVISIQNAVLSDPRGNLKISPQGNLMVSCSMATGTFIYDYDNTSGIVSNERRLILSNGSDNAGFGVEFSPDGELLYIAASNNAGGNTPSNHSNTLYQFDLMDTAAISQNFITNGVVIDSRQGYRSTLQLGIDGKIYMTTSESYDNGRPFLNVIGNPTVRGLGCNFQADAIRLTTGVARQGLPPFIQSLFALIEVENTCEGDTTEFSYQSENMPTSISWDFGDGTTSNLETPTHIYAAAGVYNVVLTLTVNGAIREFRKNVEIFSTPTANPIDDLELCDNDGSGSEDLDLGVYAFDTLVGMQTMDNLDVTFFSSLADAIANENSIAEDAVFDIGTEEVFARLFNRNNSDCAEITSFDVSVFEVPVSSTPDNLEVCDDDFDGFISFDLEDQDADILTQDPAQFTVSYHLSQADADTGDNPLVSPYTNTTAFNQTIFVRIENNDFEGCDVSDVSFDLIVNEKPRALDFNAFQCDEDGVQDGRTIFNLSSFDDSIVDNATGVTVDYFLNTADASNDRNPLPDDYTNISAPQNIIARVTNDTTGCTTTSTVTLDVSGSDAQDTSLEQCDNDGMADGIIQFDLSLADGDVLINAPADVVVVYYPTLNDALTEQNSLPAFYTNTVAGNELIYARAESSDGNCFGISEVTLTVNNPPVLEPDGFEEYCGNDPQPLELQPGITTGDLTEFDYLWSTGETTPTIQVGEGGIYTVEVTNDDGCTSTRSIDVVISETATIDAITVTNAGGNPTGSATVQVSGRGGYEFSLEPFFGYQDEKDFRDLAAGFYTVSVQDKNGCGIATQDFIVVGYPRFFTPNGDGFNDRWQLIGVSNVFEQDSLIYIFDRHGRLLKQIFPQGAGWDGTFNNIELPSSDYWFRATLMDGSEFSGHFTLKR